MQDACIYQPAALNLAQTVQRAQFFEQAISQEGNLVGMADLKLTGARQAQDGGKDGLLFGGKRGEDRPSTPLIV